MFPSAQDLLNAGPELAPFIVHLFVLVDPRCPCVDDSHRNTSTVTTWKVVFDDLCDRHHGIGNIVYLVVTNSWTQFYQHIIDAIKGYAMHYHNAYQGNHIQTTLQVKANFLYIEMTIYTSTTAD